jgi:hypothetical protein
MSCPHDFDGKPGCHITAHPDHPDQHFCCFCNKPIRFVNEPDNSLGVWFFLFFIAAVIVFVTLPKSNNEKTKTTSFSESPQYALSPRKSAA